MPELTSSWFTYLLGVLLLFVSMALVASRRKNMRLTQEAEETGQKLRKSKRKLAQWKRGWGAENQHILEALSDAFILINSEDRIMFANKKAEQLFREELEGVSLSELDKEHSLHEEVRKALAHLGDGYTAEFSLSGQDTKNQDIYCFIDAAPVEGIENYKRVIIRNITNQHITEQMRKEFVANASHELRTPMTIIMGYLETLQEDGFMENSPEMARKFTDTMFNHGKRIQHIIEDMLTISRLESGEHVQLKMSDFLLRDCVQDVFDRLSPVAEARGATLISNISPPDITLHGDFFYWTQIFFNLVENALKNNPDSPISVSITTNQTSSRTQITITDTGKGIPPAHLPFIFTRFYRIEQSTRKIPGTGLGLSIVKHALEAHNATISATSIPNVETCFCITLPH